MSFQHPFPLKSAIVPTLFAAVLFFANSAKATPVLPTIPGGIFNVTNATFGAKADGVSTNTTAIQNAINAASTAGGGTVEIPAGTNVYLCGPITLKNSINLQIDSGATLEMLPFGSWPGTSTFISGSSLHDVEISGAGTIDGQGAAWWAAFNADGVSRPNFIQFSSCNRVLIQGVTLQNPPTFHIMIKNNNANITVQNITINTPGTSPNTDGFDIASTNVLIQNCFVSDGDDNVEIGGSQKAADIVVTNCTFGTGHGVSVGSITSGGVSNVTVVNCTFSGTDYGIRLKSDNSSSGGGAGGLCQNFSFSNIGMTNIVRAAIVIYSYYEEFGTPTSITPATAAAQAVDPVTATTVVWRNINISNVTATVTGGSSTSGIIWGRTELPATNITLSHVNITAPKTFAVYNARNVQFIDSKITLPGGNKTFTLFNADVTVSNSAPATGTISFDGLTSTNKLTLYDAPAVMGSTNAFGANPISLNASILTVTNSLTLDDSTTQNFALGTNASGIAVTRNLILNSTLNITNADGFGPGSYTLFTYSGTLSGSPILGSTVPGFFYTISTNTPGQVNLLVSTPAPPSPPNFGSIVTTGNGLVMSGNGGTANGTYFVLTSTNLALPLDQWTRVATNQFDGDGNFIFTNAPDPNLPQRFYMLQLP